MPTICPEIHHTHSTGYDDLEFIQLSLNNVEGGVKSCEAWGSDEFTNMNISVI